MLILSIETSGREGSVALVDNQQVVDSQPLSKAGRRHAQSLVSEIDLILKKQQVTYADCAGIAVSIGPGSFTGLRVGVVCAKTFAYALGCPLVAVDTFQAIAHNTPAEFNEVYVTGNAQRNEIFVGKFIRGDDDFFEVDDPVKISSKEKFIASLSKNDLVTGSGVSLIQVEIDHCCQSLSSEHWSPQAGQIGILGERMIQQQQTVSAWELVPHYIRLSAAEEKRLLEEGELSPATDFKEGITDE